MNDKLRFSTLLGANTMSSNARLVQSDLPAPKSPQNYLSLIAEVKAINEIIVANALPDAAVEALKTHIAHIAKITRQDTLDSVS